ncbi:hypothetical protein [Streptomyces sp. Z26]|uniref:hypothetical protein n=1 Tax=Streptomyces sp. Z26 TaxID=2500177 RepID=UPI0014045DA9|nr:hypothetical protein [Streptomyces sp. Z26]
MATRKTTPKRTAKKCTTCDGAGEIRESVRVGTRKGRATADQQTAMCPSCWGSGEAD